MIFPLASYIMFTDNWKVLVLNFLEAKNVDGKMIFTDYWKVLFWTFRRWEIQSFFESRSWWKRWYLLITEKFLFRTFWWWEKWSFFQPKSWWKDSIYFVFLSFPWYSRTWEIWFFVQWHHINFQVVAAEMFQVKNEMSPEVICDISPKRINNHHNLRYTNHFETHFVRTVLNGMESVSYLGPKI